MVSGSVRILALPRFIDRRGSMTYLEPFTQVPMSLERVELIQVGPSQQHVIETRVDIVLIALCGGLDVESNGVTFSLRKPDEALYATNGRFEIRGNGDAVALVVGSQRGQTVLCDPVIETPWRLLAFPQQSSLELSAYAPFEVRRIYYLYGVSAHTARGGHAHKKLEGLMVAARGSFAVRLETVQQVQEFQLTGVHQGLLIGNRVWREVRDFSEDAVCLVLASGFYDEDEMIRDRDTFLTFPYT